MALALLATLPSAAVAQTIVPAPPDGSYVPPGWSLVRFDAVAGEAKTFSASLGDTANCTNLRDVVVNWGDGTQSSGTAASAGGNSWTLAGTHTYAAAGDYAGAADVTATCTNSQGQASELRQLGKLGGYPQGFITHVTTAGSSCPLPGSAAARISQAGTSCDPVPPCAKYRSISSRLQHAHVAEGA